MPRAVLFEVFRNAFPKSHKDVYTVGGHVRKICTVQSSHPTYSIVNPRSLALALFVQEDGLTSATFTAEAMTDSWQPPHSHRL